MFYMCYYIIYYEVKEQKNTINTLKLRFFYSKTQNIYLESRKHVKQKEGNQTVGGTQPSFAVIE